ncbi:M48 family metalloprotease [Candidatus Venteria ishoeyi]|uniref:M48 family metalloprotease n=1 Tax=Candidatus Venteria ishoeyi TaxID=1899563 RepID=UPI0025A53D32|nr:M48 family metalloprotease [Candidatus Venteria ishoeyi]MDM8547047.1 M48 family metalloprotease [Candidatus Venteria ishoeyi]
MPHFSSLLLSLLLTLVTAPSLLAESTLPDIGNPADQSLSPAEEMEQGQAFFREIRQQAYLLEDPEVENYINSLGYNLGSHSQQSQQSFRFFVVKDDSINAFAAPGGFIGVNTGLILKTHNEGELAAVMAHEVAHVTQRHIARRDNESTPWSMASMAMLAAAILIGTQNPELGQAGIMTALAANMQVQIDFTRAHEAEADRVGIDTLAGAGFDPLSMPDFFQRLQDAYKYTSGEEPLPEFLRTHPVTLDRIAEARDRADDYPHQLQESSVAYQLARAKILVLSSDDAGKLLKQLKKSLAQKKYRSERAVRYGIALAGLKTENTKYSTEIQQQLDWLRQKDNDRENYRILAAQLAMLNQQPETAASICRQTLDLYPGDRMVTLACAQIFLDSQQSQTTETILSQLPDQKNFNYNPAYYRLLAKAQHDRGKTAASRLSMAEAYYQNGQTGQAVTQLKLARKAKMDFYLASQIDARLEELEALLLAQNKRPDKKQRKKEDEEP